MKSHSLSEYLNHFNWLNERTNLWALLDVEEPMLDFSNCKWIDPVALSDILLLVTLHLERGKAILFNLGSNSEPSHLLMIRFLFDSGFMDSINKNPHQDHVTIFLETHQYSIHSLIAFYQNFNFPKPILNQVFIIPCIVIDVNTKSNRQEVYDYCRDLTKEYLSADKIEVYHLPYDLLQECKVFLSTALPELIDNVRIHKSSREEKLVTLLLRLRKREHLSLNPPIGYIYSKGKTRFDKKTSELWQTDVVEAAFIDFGPSIQDTFIKSKSSDPTISPAKAIKDKYNVDITGPNGDLELLKNIFEQPMSSLSPAKRSSEGLTEITGLYAIKYCMEGFDWHIAIRSGQNSIVISSEILDDENLAYKQVHVKAEDNYNKSPGVQYIFKIGSQEGYALDGWYELPQHLDIENDRQYWINEYPAKFNNIFVVDDYKIPSEANGGDVIICRPQDLITKYTLKNYLKDLGTKKIEVCFVDVPVSVGIRIFLTIQSDWNNINKFCPIITETLQFNISGPRGRSSIISEKLINSFVHSKIEGVNEWWTKPDYPLNSFKDVFNRCRQYDSEVFWGSIDNDKYCFRTDKIEWGKDTTLIGGYLSFNSIICKIVTRDIIEKRSKVVVHALKVGEIIPTSNVLRNMVSRLKNRTNLSRNIDSNKTLLLSSVEVTGETSKEAYVHHNNIFHKSHMPVFLYPNQYVFGNNIPPVNEKFLRILDWKKLNDDEIKQIQKQPTPLLCRIGTTGRVRYKPAGELLNDGLESPSNAYKVLQQNQHIVIGHFSHQRHHFFLWINLISFIKERSSQSSEFYHRITLSIIESQTDTIYYASNEITEALIERLVQHMKGEKIQFNFNRIFPISLVTDFIHIPTNSIGCSTEVKPYKSDVAFFIDDINVTGKTIRHAVDSLKMIGYKKVATFTIINMNPNSMGVESRLPSLSWWNIQINPSGTEGGCLICHGCEKLMSLSKESNSKIFSEIILRWVNHWAKEEAIQKFQNRIEKNKFKEPISVKIGWNDDSKNISLKYSDDTALWYFDMAARLEYYGYIFEETGYDIKQASTEIYSGLILIKWKELGEKIKYQTLAGVVSRIYNEQRETAIALLAICIVSLPQKDKQTLFVLYEKNIIEDLFPNYISSVIYNLLLMTISTSSEEMIKLIQKLSKRIEENVVSGKIFYDKEKLRMARSFLYAMVYNSDNKKNDYKLVMNLLGYPGQNDPHNRITEILSKCEDNDHAGVIELVHELVPLIEPIKELISTRELLFAEFGINSEINDMFTRFDKFVKGINNVQIFNSMTDSVKEDSILSILGQYLFTDIKGRPCIRRILWWEYLHHLPFLVPLILVELVEAQKVYGNEIQFVSELDYLTSEQIQNIYIELKNIHDRKRIMEMEREYFIFDLICINHVIIVNIVRDLLLDIKHARVVRKEYPEGCKMKIYFQTIKDPNSDKSYFILETRNNCFAGSQDRCEGGVTWNKLKLHVEENNGKAFVYENAENELCKQISFPIHKKNERKGK